eukprot:m.34283 g.34283  ORF g.34283 m.34283 type:complete len:871 (+) comp9755_c0_seq1:254-2866(+)
MASYRKLGAVLDAASQMLNVVYYGTIPQRFVLGEVPTEVGVGIQAIRTMLVVLRKLSDSERETLAHHIQSWIDAVPSTTATHEARELLRLARVVGLIWVVTKSTMALSQRYLEETVMRISQGETVSASHVALFMQISEKDMKAAVHEVVSRCHTKESLGRVLNTWLLWLMFPEVEMSEPTLKPVASNTAINRWLEELLVELTSPAQIVHQYAQVLLVEAACKWPAVLVQAMLLKPRVRLQMLPILRRLLLGPRLSSSLFHTVLPSCLNLVKTLTSDYQADPTDRNHSNMFSFFVMMHAAVQLHSGFPALYSDLMDALSATGITTPAFKVISQLLDAHKWQFAPQQHHSAAAMSSMASSSSARAVFMSPYTAGPRAANTPTGLRNLGNTCFLNSVVQLLFASQSFRQGLLQLDIGTANAPITRATIDLLKSLTSSTVAHISPSQFVGTCLPAHFVRGQQQDSMEFLQMYMGALQDEIAMVLRKKDKAAACAKANSNGTVVIPDATSVAHSSPQAKKRHVTAGQASALNQAATYGNPNHTAAMYTSEPAASRSTQQSVQADETNLSSPASPVGTVVATTSTIKPASDVSAEADWNPGCECQKRSDNLIETFMGKSRILTVCDRCKYSSTRKEEFSVLSLPIPSLKEAEQELGVDLSVIPVTQLLSVPSLLQYDTRIQSLTKNNQYMCPSCDSMQDAKTQLRYTEMPPLLLISLKRFGFNAKTQQRFKLFPFVSFPEHIKVPVTTSPADGLIEENFVASLNPRGTNVEASATKQPTQPDGGDFVMCSYRLLGFVIHSGMTAHSGHYYTYARHEERWFLLNDSRVTRMPSLDAIWATVQKQPYDSVYVAAYECQDTKGSSASPADSDGGVCSKP